MNVYELADEIKGWGDDLLALNMKGGVYVNEAAVMLRQQADEYKILEKLHQDSLLQNEELLDRIAELEKQLSETQLPPEFTKVLHENLSDLYETNAEPVGVVCEFEGIMVGTLFEKLPDGTKLYATPQTKD